MKGLSFIDLDLDSGYLNPKTLIFNSRLQLQNTL